VNTPSRSIKGQKLG